MGKVLSRSSVKLVTMSRKYMLRSTLSEMKLHSKPKCPHCNRPLFFWYGATGGGSIYLKCEHCKQDVMVNLSSEEVTAVLNDE